MGRNADDDIESIVRELYIGILGREPDPTYLQNHVAHIRVSGIRGGVSHVIRGFLQTDEFKRRSDESGKLASQVLINSSRVYLERLIREFAGTVPADSLVLDVGAGDAPYRRLFDHARYESADFEKVAKRYGETTYVCDVTDRIPVEDGRFGHLLFSQTLEHLKEPALALRELYRVLAPGGAMLCTVPLFYEEHEQPHDYFRYTQFAHRYLFHDAGFEIEKIEWLEGFFGTCGYMLECIYKYMPTSVPGTVPESLWARAFLAAFKPLALSAAGAFYRLDLSWKVTNVGFPKNYAIFARKKRP